MQILEYYFMYVSFLYKWYKIYKLNYFQNYHGQGKIQQEEISFHQQIGLKFKEEIGDILRLEHSFVWYQNLDIPENRSELLWKFWIVVLE
jgi:hypothetical protein